MTVSLSVISGPATSSTVQADGDKAHTSPLSLDAATIGSTTEGLLSFSRSIFTGLFFMTSGLVTSCNVPFPSSDSSQTVDLDLESKMSSCLCN